MEDLNWNLKKATPALRILISWFILALCVGYGVALLKVYDQTHFETQRIITFYRGDDEGLILPPSFSTLLAVTHVHSLSQPMMFFITGLIFYFSSFSEKIKKILYQTMFGAYFLSLSAPWILRYGSVRCEFLLPLSQGFLGTSFLIMCFLSLKDLWCGRRCCTHTDSKSD